MKSNTVAIDFGSSNTAIYKLGAGVVLFEPSVVAVNASSGKIKAVGTEAKQLIGKTSEVTKIVFPVVEGQIDDEKAATALLDNFLNKITLSKLGIRPKVLFSLPCGTERPEVKKFESVLRGAGVYNYQFVEAPILTAIGMGIPVSEYNPCFLIDIGGGTTGMSALSLDGVIAGVNINMGGRNLDAMLIDYIYQYFNLSIGALTAEKIKIQIGSLIENDATRMTVSGRDVSTGKPRSISVGAHEIYLPIKMFFEKLIEIAGMVMAKLPAEVSAEIRRSGVYISGGTSKIVGLADYFREKTAIKVNVAQEPELATAIGGGIVAGDGSLLKKLKLSKRG